MKHKPYRPDPREPMIMLVVHVVRFHRSFLLHSPLEMVQSVSHARAQAWLLRSIDGQELISYSHKTHLITNGMGKGGDNLWGRALAESFDMHMHDPQIAR